MTSENSECPRFEGQVLLLASDEREASEICDLLTEGGVPVKVCGGLDNFRRCIQEDPPAAVITAQFLRPPSAVRLFGILSADSDYTPPALIILSDGDTTCSELGDFFQSTENTIILERPLGEATLVSTVRSAIGAWRRQHELRQRLAEREKREQIVRGSERQLQEQKETLQQRVADRTAEAERRAEQLRALAAQLTRVEQRERRRLAQMLHDQLQQLLVASLLKLGSIRRRVQDDQLDEAFQQLDKVLNEAIEASRSLTVELSPPILYDAGLAAALEWLARQTQENHGLQVDVEVSREAEPVDEELRILLFQAVRELLFNVVKHAKVDRAQVKMTELGDDQVQILVTDNGVGFNPEQLEVVEISVGGFGLFNMQERIESIGGHVEVDSTPGEGTRVTIVAPQHPLVTASDEAVVAPSVSTTRDRDVPKGTAKKIRVLLADDHDMLREGLASILSEASDMELVGEADDGQQAVELAMQTRPDVVVMDVAMPRVNGIEATRRILAALPQTRVIGLSMHKREDMETAMREAGAVDYVPKGNSAETLIDTIRGIASG